jgi:hypothetical protein
MDDRKSELYLTETDSRVLEIGSTITTIFFVLGLVLYVTASRAISFGSFMVALLALVWMLIYFVIGEINLRISERNQRYKDIETIVRYCYNMFDNQYETYLGILKATIKKNKHSLMTMHFSDFSDADKWAQTVEKIKLERKWTHQLSLEHGIKIRA